MSLQNRVSQSKSFSKSGLWSPLAALMHISRILPVYMSIRGTLGKQYEMTVAHPCLHEKPRWICFHILNGLNHALICLTTTKPIKNQDNSSPRHKTLFCSMLFVIHSDLFQESAGTEMYLSRPRVRCAVDIMSVSEPKREPLSNSVPVCVQLISVYSMWWIIEQHSCHSLSGYERSVTLTERTLL